MFRKSSLRFCQYTNLILPIDIFLYFHDFVRLFYKIFIALLSNQLMDLYSINV